MDSTPFGVDPIAIGNAIHDHLDAQLKKAKAKLDLYGENFPYYPINFDAESI